MFNTKVTCHECKCLLYKDDAYVAQNLTFEFDGYIDGHWELEKVYFCKSHYETQLLKDGDPVDGIDTKDDEDEEVVAYDSREEDVFINPESAWDNVEPVVHASTYDGTPPNDTPKPRSEWDMSKWSAKWDVDQCRGCGRDDVEHAAKGYCKPCYSDEYYDEE